MPTKINTRLAKFCLIAYVCMAFSVDVFAEIENSLIREEEVKEITVSDAFQIALDSNPDLRVLELERDVGKGALMQAGLLPNPEISVEAESIFGTGPYRGTKSSEITMGLSQLIELGNKRNKRKNLAVLEKELIEWDFSVRRAALWLEVKTVFTALLIAQERVNLSSKQIGLAEEFLAAVKLRMESGRGSSIEVRRAKINLHLKKTEFLKVEKTLALVRQQLSLILSNSPAGNFIAHGTLALDEAPPSQSVLLRLMENSPMLRRYQDEKERARAVLEVEKSKAIPNVSVFGGVRRINDGSETALVLGLGVPLPVFDRNQGNIYSARAKGNQLAFRKDATRLQLQNLLVLNHEAITAAYHEAKMLRDDIIPEAESTLSDIDEGYNKARYSLLDVLDSQRIFFDVKTQYLDAISRYHQAYSQIQWLVNSETITSSQ